MAEPTRFILADGRHVVLDNRLVFDLDPDYSAAIFEKIQFVEKQYDAEFAMRFVSALDAQLPGKIAQPDDATTAMFGILHDSVVKKAGLGTRQTCSKCSRKYYNKNNPDMSCPSCPKPVLAAVLPAKQGE